MGCILQGYFEAGGQKLIHHRHVGVTMRMMPAVLKKDILKEFDRFDSKPKEFRRWTRQRIQWLKWEEGQSANRKHHLLDGGDGGSGALDDLDPNASA